jgi:DNA-binding transcriptional LysR family regulator
VTDVGAAVLGYAREALGAASGAQLAVDAFTGLIRGSVAVGMVIACSSFDFAELLAGYHRSYPAVEIALSEANSDELIARLQSGQLDLAYIALGGVAPAGLDLLEIADEALVAAVSQDDALVTCRSMPLAAIGDRTLLSLPRGTGIRAIFDDACAGIGLKPRITLEASNLGILARLASLGLGVAILPESVAAATAGLHAIEITDPRMRGKVALAWRTDGPTGPAAQALIRRAREAMAGV